ncbi:MAG TPA: nickel pincer cofactor biosynthesis protein LarB [Polyangiaceae bacterium]|jgi:hypothetical protein|nr:nickel pincer cofactor biosynthesis protein LarB [Polyangiaceae bacterium]
MDVEGLTRMLGRVASGELAPTDALRDLAQLPFTDLGFARVDQHRALRQGVAEVIFAQGKTAQQVVAIAQELARHDHPILVTRVSTEQAELVLEALPAFQHDRVARTLVRHGTVPSHRATTRVCVVTAGTADVPVAYEAVSTLRASGIDTELLCDVGVAGLHRLLAELPRLRQAHALIVVAGMEGALASVVGGLVAAPVIAVPTSVGYGVSAGGYAALISMLSSCAAGVTVVNIDNGFGAAMAAVRMIDSLAAPRT